MDVPELMTGGSCSVGRGARTSHGMFVCYKPKYIGIDQRLLCESVFVCQRSFALMVGRLDIYIQAKELRDLQGRAGATGED